MITSIRLPIHIDAIIPQNSVGFLTITCGPGMMPWIVIAPTMLTPPIRHTLESAIEFIADDELVEITPKSIRIRKRFLKEHERKRMRREAA